MARFNEILVGRYNRLFQKLFQIKGTAPVPVLSTEIQPQIQIFNGEENRYLEGWHLYAQAQVVAAQGVGLFSAIRLRNPLNSGVIAVVTKAIIANSTAALAAILETGASNLDLQTVSNAFRIDPRGPTNSSLLFSSGNSGSLVTQRVRNQLPANSGVDLLASAEIPILPGEILQLIASLGNNAADFSLWWRERFLEESERT